MKFFSLFFFFSACVYAFDFEYDNGAVVLEDKDADKLESVLPQTTTVATTTATPTKPAQEPLGREVPSSFEKETSREIRTATATTTTTTVTTTARQPAQEPLGREEMRVDDLTTTATSPIKPIGATNQPQSVEILFKPSLYALINEGLKSNLRSFEARIANLLYKREQMKEEIQLFADESSTDFAAELNPDHFG